MDTAQKIEALLFYRAEPVSIKTMSTLLGEGEDAIHNGLHDLRTALSGRGLVLVENDEKFSLGTHPELSNLIEELVREDLHKDLGKAGRETLAIIVYRGPLTKSDIDYIRGVNSHFILRNLSIRGLVEKVPNPKNTRSFLYKPSTQLLEYLGVSSLEEMPEYTSYREEVERFLRAENEQS